MLIKCYQIANPSPAALYEDALVYETGSAITSSGALSAYSGAKTGRSPSDKRIVEEPSSKDNVWWGPVNKPMSPEVSSSGLISLLACLDKCGASMHNARHQFALEDAGQTCRRHSAYLHWHCRAEPRNLQFRVFSACLLYTSPSPRDGLLSRMPSSA